MTAPTEQDLAVARRVLQQHYRNRFRGARFMVLAVEVAPPMLDAALDGARLGREYAERERGAR